MKTLSVKVKTNARTSELIEAGDGSWRASLKSPPVDGRANAELINLVAAHFAVPKAAVSIKSGASSRMKLLRIA